MIPASIQPKSPGDGDPTWHPLCGDARPSVERAQYRGDGWLEMEIAVPIAMPVVRLAKVLWLRLSGNVVMEVTDLPGDVSPRDLQWASVATLPAITAAEFRCDGWLRLALQIPLGRSPDRIEKFLWLRLAGDPVKFQSVDGGSRNSQVTGKASDVPAIVFGQKPRS